MYSETPQGGFAQIVGEHAIHMVEMARADAAQDKKRLMQTWLRLDKVNARWSGLLVSCDDGLAEHAPALVNAYAEALADYMVRDRQATRSQFQARVEKVCSLEGDFYARLGDDPALRSAWIVYTRGLVGLTRELDARNGNLEGAGWEPAAAGVIYCGLELGHALDRAILLQSEIRRK